MMPSLAAEGCNHWPARRASSSATNGNLIGEVAAPAVSSAGQVPTFYPEIIMINDGSPESDIPGDGLAQGNPQTTNTSANKLAYWRNWRAGRGALSELWLNRSRGETGIIMMKMLHVIRLLLNRELFSNASGARRWRLSIASITIICFCLASISADGISASRLGFAAGPAESPGESS